MDTVGAGFGYHTNVIASRGSTERSPVWAQIVSVAGRSPSTHNTQAWRIRIESEREATLCYDREGTLPAEDVKGDFNLINMGVFTRGAEIAAASIGHRLQWNFVLDESDPSLRYVPVAALSLESDPKLDDAQLLDPFLERRTSRIPYDGQKLEPRDLHALRDLAARAGHEFAWTQEEENVRWFLNLNAETIVEDLQQQAIRRELHQWMRFTRFRARRTGDGLWSRCMNQNAFLMWFMIRYPHVLKARWVNQALQQGYLRTQAGTPAVGWIEGVIETREDQFAAGRFVLDFWIELHRLGIDMMPYGSLYTNQASNLKIGERTGAPGFWLIFRMGHGVRPPQSFRRPAAQLFI